MKYCTRARVQYYYRARGSWIISWRVKKRKKSYLCGAKVKRKKNWRFGYFNRSREGAKKKESKMGDTMAYYDGGVDNRSEAEKNEDYHYWRYRAVHDFVRSCFPREWFELDEKLAAALDPYPLDAGHRTRVIMKALGLSLPED